MLIQMASKKSILFLKSERNWHKKSPLVYCKYLVQQPVILDARFRVLELSQLQFQTITPFNRGF